MIGKLFGHGGGDLEGRELIKLCPLHGTVALELAELGAVGLGHYAKGAVVSAGFKRLL